MKPVILDVDTGTDDAIALLMAVRSKACNLLGVTTVSGNVGVDQATINTLKVLDAAGATHIPVAKGEALPLSGREPNRPKVTATHGADGLANVPLPDTKRTVDSRSAVDFLVEMILNHPEPVTLIPLAAQTNIALALKKEPRIAANIAEIIFMGGSVAVGGNASAAAEFNIFNDPEAAAFVAESGLKLTMVPLDACIQAKLDDRAVAALEQAGTPWTLFCAAVLKGRMETAGSDFTTPADPAAVGYFLQPDLFRAAPYHVAVDCADGPARGATIVDRRVRRAGPAAVPNMDVIVEVASGYQDLVIRTLTA